MSGALSPSAAIAELPDGRSASQARGALEQPGIEAVTVARPPLDDLPYRTFVRALLGRQGFKLDFRGQSPNSVLAMVADRLLGPGAYASEHAMLAEQIAGLEDFAQDLAGTSTRPQTAIRTYFAPGDLVWHVDRVNERTAFRLLWPIGRPAGMFVTAADNIYADIYRAYMRREHPLLCKLDTRVLQAGVDVERYWQHRPEQLAAMRSGKFPFVRNSEAVSQVPANAISIHRIETPEQHGTYHRSCWDNRAAPGLQIVITVAAD